VYFDAQQLASMHTFTTLDCGDSVYLQHDGGKYSGKNDVTVTLFCSCTTTEYEDNGCACNDIIMLKDSSHWLSNE